MLLVKLINLNDEWRAADKSQLRYETKLSNKDRIRIDEKRRVKTHDYESRDGDRNVMWIRRRNSTQPSSKRRRISQRHELWLNGQTNRHWEQGQRDKDGRCQRKCEGKEYRQCFLLLLYPYAAVPKSCLKSRTKLPYDLYPRIFRLPGCHLIFPRPISGRADDKVVQLEGDRRCSST